MSNLAAKGHYKIDVSGGDVTLNPQTRQIRANTGGSINLEMGGVAITYDVVAGERIDCFSGNAKVLQTGTNITADHLVGLL